MFLAEYMCKNEHGYVL